MAAPTTYTKFLGSISQLLVRQRPSLSLWNTSSIHTAAVLEAARKGTRAKAEAKKRASKKEVVKKEYVPLKKRQELLLSGGRSPRRIEDHLKVATDNVFFNKYYRRMIYSFREAIAMHRETHHESQFNDPSAIVNAYIELDLAVDKKNRYLDNFSEVIKLPHNFDSVQQRNLLVISKSQEVLDYAKEAGATLALGTEVIKMAQNEEVNLSDYKFVVSDLDLLPELVAIRGLMKKQFPNPKNGTAGNDLIPIIDRFLQGIEYKTEKNKYHQDYATIEVSFGKLNMTDEQLEENMSTLLSSVSSRWPKQRKSSELITMVVVHSPPSRERFKIDHLALLEVQVKEAVAVAQ